VSDSSFEARSDARLFMCRRFLDILQASSYGKSMKNIVTASLVFGVVFAAGVAVAGAATKAGLVSGGVGQVVNDMQAFQVAICNHGAQASKNAVPVTMSANGANAVISSAAAIGAGECQYAPVSYAALNLAAGGTYSIAVQVGANTETYSITVPGGTASTGASGTHAANTAEAAAQGGNIFTSIWNWIASLFR